MTLFNPFIKKLLLFALISGTAFAQQARLHGPIGAGRRVTLSSRIHPLANTQNDRGLVDPTLPLEYVTMVFQPTAAQQSDLDSLLAAQQDRKSPQYHKWLTPDQFGDRFGLASSDVAQISQWISAQGFHIDDTARGRNWIAFSGTADQFDRAFETHLHRFVVQGKEHYANTAPPALPGELAGLVRLIRGLDNFEPDPPSAIANAMPMPEYTSSTGAHSLAPADFATIYDLNPLYNNGIKGDGQTIAILGRAAINLNDYRTFRTLYGLPATIPVMHLVGANPGSNNLADLGEAMLDLEWSGAVAPNATIVYVYATGIYTAAQEAIDKNLASIMSESFGSCELNSGDSVRYLAQQANAQGITWMAAAGDSGAAGCDAHTDRPLASVGFAAGYPASIPEITGVGGTMFNEGTDTYWNSSNATNGLSARSYIPEVVWNSNTLAGLAAGGGGVSVYYSKPLWQNGPGVPDDKARDVPDMSLNAAGHDGYRVYQLSANYTFYGTSAGAPSMAGIVALLNQYLVQNGSAQTQGLGNINPNLYRLAQTYPAAFHDITSGDNDVPCMQGSPNCSTGSFGYSAGPGYDLATGLGSLDVNNLVTHWNQTGAASSTAVTPGASPIAFNTRGQLAATVTGSGGGPAPTGTVSFLIPGGAAGTQAIGSATLGNNGGTASATISVDPNQLLVGDNTVVALYSGDNVYESSSGTTTLTVTAPDSAAAVTASITPNPVNAALSLGVKAWVYTITLTESAGVGATLTGFSINQSAQSVGTLFSTTKIPANGSITTTLKTTSIPNTPANLVYAFSGTDSNGHAWSQQVTLQFINQLDLPGPVLTSVPSNVQRNPSADASCQWMQRINVTETGGYPLQLTKLLAGSTDLSKQIAQYFGSTQLAPYGTLQATICNGGDTPPPSTLYEVDGQSDSGGVYRAQVTATYSAAPAAPAAMSVGQSSIAMSTADTSGTATRSLDIQFSSLSSTWTAAVFPANLTTSWLTLSTASGSGAGTIALKANASGLSPGVYHALVIVQGVNAVPQYIEIPVSFTVGASSNIQIGGVANGASFQGPLAPGMILSVFGSGLAPTTEAASSVPLPLSIQGVSATVNGVAAPLYFVAPGQINLQMPYETGAHNAVVGINNNGKVASYSFDTTPAGPGIFVNNGALVPSSSGKPGDVLVMFITGEGDVTPTLDTGTTPAVTTPLSLLPAPRLPLTLTVGGIQVTPLFVGIPPALVGVTQVNFTIPAGIGTGQQQVVVTSNGVSSAPAMITVTN
jgi:uncharacterized protein (TIGR03437 family)